MVLFMSCRIAQQLDNELANYKRNAPQKNREEYWIKTQ